MGSMGPWIHLKYLNWLIGYGSYGLQRPGICQDVDSKRCICVNFERNAENLFRWTEQMYSPIHFKTC